jgi:nitroreductase
MKILELVRKRRTIRRFKQNPIEKSQLQDIVDAARLAPSASNLQPLLFISVDEPGLVQSVFVATKWAGYLPAEQGRPQPGEEPVAFIVILVDRTIRPNGGGQDVGAATENMILTALEMGIGSCLIASVDRAAVRKVFEIPDYYDIDAVLALGYPAEDPVVEEMKTSVKYYRGADGQLRVPKRTLTYVWHHNQFSPEP